MRGFSLTAAGVVGVLDVAHEADGPGWAADVGGALTRAGGGALGATALLSYRPSEGLAPLQPLSGAFGELIETGQAALSGSQSARVYARQPTAIASSEVFGNATPEAFDRTLRGLGMLDFLGMTAPLGADGSFSIGVGLVRDQGIEPRGRRRLAGLTLHLSTLWQARRVFDDAVLDDGPPSSEPRVLERRLDRALARARRVRGEDTAAEAVSAWNALLHEGWMIVHRGGGGGRRRVVLARVPRYDGAETPCLTLRECQVIDGVASALSNKEVAFDLGIPEACVATTLLRARRKLGARSRLELVQLKRWLAHEPVATGGPGAV